MPGKKIDQKKFTHRKKKNVVFINVIILSMIAFKWERNLHDNMIFKILL